MRLGGGGGGVPNTRSSHYTHLENEYVGTWYYLEIAETEGGREAKEREVERGRGRGREGSGEGESGGGGGCKEQKSPGQDNEGSGRGFESRALRERGKCM